ncbi:MAG: hypothetical protein WBM80_09275 [Woeseiaceae bacterium]
MPKDVRTLSRLRQACAEGKLDEKRDFDKLFDFVSYHYFEARKYPNLVELIKSQGNE